MRYVEVKPNTFAMLFTDEGLYTSGLVMSAGYWALIACVSFVLQLRTLFAYRRMTKEYKQKYHSDFLLFCK